MVADLVLYLAQQLVDDPEAVRVERVGERGRCARPAAARRRGRSRQGDRARGRMVRALRTIARAAGGTRPAASCLEIVGYDGRRALRRPRRHRPRSRPCSRKFPTTPMIVCGGDCAAGPLPARDARARAQRLATACAGSAATLIASSTRRAGHRAAGGDRSWVRDQLTAEEIAFLTAGGAVELEVEGVGMVLYCHATPRNDTEVFIEGTPDERVAPMLDGRRAPTSSSAATRTCSSSVRSSGITS